MVSCEVCKQPVLAPGDGVLELSSQAAAEEANRWEQYRTLTKGQIASMAEFPTSQKAHWRFSHKSCPSDGHDYWIGLERIDTPQRALGWTAHLFDKNWMGHTDWFDALTKLGFVDRSA